MIAIVDYGVGNLFSLKSSLEFIGREVVITGDAEVLRHASHVFLPGGGAFGDARAKLRESGLDTVVCEIAAAGVPLMGICLGMQLLFDKSFEYGEHEGLGLIPGEVRPLADAIDPALLIPHIGWNELTFRREPESPIFAYVNEGDSVYFVHSYYACKCAEHTIAVTDYDIAVTAAVQRGNVYGCQFHPEKSGAVGLSILRAFCEIGVK